MIGSVVAKAWPYALGVLAFALVAAGMLLAPEVALAQQGGGGIDIQGAANELVLIAGALILAVVFLRAIPDIGKRAYVPLLILLFVGGIVYYFSQNPESLSSVGEFVGELLNM